MNWLRSFVPVYFYRAKWNDYLEVREHRWVEPKRPRVNREADTPTPLRSPCLSSKEVAPSLEG